MIRTLGPVLVLAALATGCGGNGGDGSTVDPTSPPATTTGAASSCPAPPPLPAGATVVSATVSGGKVTTEHGEWAVKLGTPVRVAVTADVADEVHVHSYDKKQDTVPGCPTAIDFVANIPGTVEVELESKGLHLFDLKAR